MLQASALRYYMLECTFLHNFAQNLLIIAVCDLPFSILNVSKKNIFIVSGRLPKMPINLNSPSYRLPPQSDSSYFHWRGK